MNRILITGGTGFIGFHLTQRLHQMGLAVRCLVRNKSRAEGLHALGVERVRGDILDETAVRRAVAGCDAVVHVAGIISATSKREFYQVNAAGTRSVARACAAQHSPPVLVLVSSQAAAGPSIAGRPRQESDAPAPVSWYGRSKLLAERYVAELAQVMPCSIVRPGVVFGETDRKTLAWFQCVDRLRMHLIPYHRPPRFGVLHVDDLVNVLIAALERGRRLPGNRLESAEPSGGICFACTHDFPRHNQFGWMIGKAVGRDHVLMVGLPEPVLLLSALGAELAGRLKGVGVTFNIDKTREIAAGDWTCSTTRMYQGLNCPPAESLPDRLRQTAESYRRRGWL